MTSHDKVTKQCSGHRYKGYKADSNNPEKKLKFET